MEIIKRSGKNQSYQKSKIYEAIKKAFVSCNIQVADEEMMIIINIVEERLLILEEKQLPVHVEQIQDYVEEALMQKEYFQVAKSYILYREKQKQKRVIRLKIAGLFQDEGLEPVLLKIQKKYQQEIYHLELLHAKFLSFYKEDMLQEDKSNMLIKAAVELTTQDAPLWEYIASLLLWHFEFKKIKQFESENQIESYYDKLKYQTDKHLLGEYILKQYSQKELEEAYQFIDETRTDLLNYSGLDLLLKRYVITTKSKQVIETPQEMYLGISLHLCINEADRLTHVKKLYDTLSLLKITLATPTLANARKPFHQLSSCFIDTVPDSLDGIYRSIDNFAKVSKFGGGMGLYFGKVRANGSTIRGFKGAAGGVIRWIKLANDTAVAVDQLGVRQGAVAIYLDVWHKDIPEFLQLKTNNGDDRQKAHDIFPAVTYPDLFWKKAKNEIDSDWYLMCPHEIYTVKGYHLEDYYGTEWEKKYLDCVQDYRISKRVIPMKDLLRMIIKSSVETGTPFTFNRDHVNRMNPNNHKGIIYCSNLCTEIAQNMSPIQLIQETIETREGEQVVVEITKPGDFVVCNLASLSLGNIDIHNEDELSEVIMTTVRALDNVIDLNYYPIPYAKITNHEMRPIGLGVSGYHHLLTKEGIRFESNEHLTFMDQLFEKINYYTLQASNLLAKEKGPYSYFKGSDFQTGDYFLKRKYHTEQWNKLKNEIANTGVRNGYLIAIAPTSSTSIIAGTTAGLDPIMSKFFLEEKKSGLVPRVAPDLTGETFWLYKSAHTIDQEWVVRSAGVRSRHIDQAQSVNLYITNEYTFRQILNLFILAWESEVKTLYYIRSKALEVEECESCAS